MSAPDTPDPAQPLTETLAAALAEEFDFSLGASISALTAPDGAPLCGHCTTVLATVGLRLGDMFAVEHRRRESGYIEPAIEATFATARAVARLLAQGPP